MNTTETILRTENLKKYFEVSKPLFGKPVYLKAVDGVNLSIGHSEAVGLVGESGCGKSTMAKLLMRLQPVTEGNIYFEGREIAHLKQRELREVRKHVQIVFQDPYASLNTRHSVYSTVSAPLRTFGIGTTAERKEMVADILDRVGLRPADMAKYPHELSGGQRQRVAIARAIILHPKFVVCDEPVSSLDVSVRAQVLNLMKDLQEEFQMSYLFISHDLSTVYYLCDVIAVMYLGRIIEVAPKQELFAHPLHPYTKVLLSAIPQPVVGREKEHIILSGDVPSPVNLPSGCRFRTRCPFATPKCAECEPELGDVGGGHKVACILECPSHSCSSTDIKEDKK